MAEGDGLVSPFPYFGGKRTIADIIWQALGDVKHYIEPFFGSGAVLLARPHYLPGAHIETICDKDGFVCNVWRALQFAPDEVAQWCDWPVNHCDLMAKKAAMIRNESRLLENLVADEKWYDPVMAGYWIWAASCWIGSGMTRPGQRPDIGHGGEGVHALGQIPLLGHGGKGVHALGQRPHLSDGGVGVHAMGRIPHISDGGKGVQEPYNTNIYHWFRQLSERLRYVRVVCGDWARVCGGNWQTNMGTCGIFFDPPYGDEAGRANDLYHEDSLMVAAEVAEWAIPRGTSKDYRIVIAGYEGEHKKLETAGWRKREWKAQGGYANLSRSDDEDDEQVEENRLKERLWMSPHCVDTARQLAMTPITRGDGEAARRNSGDGGS